MAIEGLPKQVNATEAKNRFGDPCAQAKIEPVVIEKNGRPDSFIVSYEDFQALKAAVDRKSMTLRRKEFNETYKGWIDEQNRNFDEHGLWCDGLVS